MEKNRYNIWMPLIGFDRDKEDKGVSEYLNSTGFTPKTMSVFLFHSDIINQHNGMDKEFTLHPDNCSYYGSPRNEFRERQPWTNYDLRTLAHNLADAGVEAYIGVMGVYLEDSRHKEWETDHPELLSFGVNGRMNLNVLKRFKDGTYYEDFFAEQALAAIEDYGFAGVHVSDFFCPPEHSICNGDFSTDMMEQFIEHTGIKLPENLKARLGFDDQEDIEARQEYFWGTIRQEWIDFYRWRWEKFWTNVSAKLHAAGKKIMINNSWCSDPFEAIYRYGIDYKKLYKAGVDSIVAETVPDGLELVDCTRDLFKPLMLAPQLMKAYSPDGDLYCLLGVKDCTEEWDMLHHAPTRLERAMYTLASGFVYKNGKLENAVDGYMVTLGDGITEDEWTWIRDRKAVAYSTVPQKITAPTVIWSDDAIDANVADYIKTRRPSIHNLVCRLQQATVPMGAIARIDDIASLEGVLFVPNFDLLPDQEKTAVLAYKKAPVICVASKNYTENCGLDYDFKFDDAFANYKLSAFVFNTSLTDEEKSAINDIFATPENVCDIPGDPALWYEPPFFTTPMPFVNMSDAFKAAIKKLVDFTKVSLFHSDIEIIPMKIADNVYRVYAFNALNNYVRAEIHCDKQVLKVDNISKYPLMPCKMLAKVTTAGKGDGAKAHLMQVEDPNAVSTGFIGKIPPCGLSIFDVTVK